MRDEPQAQPTDLPLARQLHRALLDLYDPPQLTRSPLVTRLDLAHQPDPLAALRRILIEAVEALKPSEATPPQANAWRTYRILLHRYIQQIPQQEIAASLGFSVRQLQRHEQAALQALADHLTARYGLAAAGAPPAPSAASEGELARLRTSFASEAISLTEVVQAALKTARPLLEAAQVDADVAVAPQLPRVAAQGIPMRQALVSLFTAAAHCAPGGCIEIRATAKAGQVQLVVRPTRGRSESRQMPDTPGGLCPDDLENVAMARELVALSGGSLQWDAGDGGPFVATLILPAAEQLAVLAIDDNLDSLHLLQRFLEGSRYPIIAEQNPIRAVELARELAPRIIILDVMLPGMDGWELLGRLREHPATRDIPVIISTILPHEQLALALGAAAFLRKPVTQAALLAMLDALAGSRMRTSDEDVGCNRR
jgi:CheY-like chemotaxis protein